MAIMERCKADRPQMALDSPSTTWPEQTPTRGFGFGSADCVVLADDDFAKTNASDTSDGELERAMMRKVMRRILPIVLVSFFVAYIDRANIGFASLTMNSDLGLSATAFGLGAGIFFLTYVALEVPSNLALQRFGARRWIARIMFTWGLASGATAFVWNDYSFYAVRLLLGAAEAGFYPGVVFFFMLWIPSCYRARALAVLQAAIPIALIVGSPISGLLMQLDGLAGLRGWQWMFLLEALPSLLMTPIILGLLSDKPDNASWLRASERDWLKKRLEEENCQAVPEQRGFLGLVRDPTIVWLCAAYFGMVGLNYGLVFFLPQIVQQFGLTIVQTGFASAIPFALSVPALMWWCGRSDRLEERRFHLLLALAVAVIGMVGSTMVGSPVLKLALLSASAVGYYPASTIFWSWSPRLMAPASAAAGIALVNSLGNLAGFVGPYATGAIKDWTGSFSGGLQLIACFGAVSLLILAVLTRRQTKTFDGSSK
jgi:MFS family permease